MNNDFWNERWQKNEIGFHRKSINHYLVNHWQTLGSSPNDSVFVPLCGKSVDLIWLAKQCRSVLAIELSMKAVADFFTENNLSPKVSENENFQVYRAENITILCGDFFKMERSDIAACSIIYDRASLIAFPPNMQEEYAKKLDALFPNPHKRLLITLDYDSSIMNGPPFATSPSTVNRLFSEYEVDHLESINIIDHSPHFEKKGLTSLIEHVFYIEKNYPSSIKT